MATIVERPLSALSDIQASAQRRRRPSIVEVIDVDLLDEPNNNSRPPPPLGRGPSMPDFISLVDSDEDEPHFSHPATASVSGSSNARAGTRQRFFSPPPPPQPREQVNIPPVPRVPRRYSGLAPLPMRRQPPPFPSTPPVVPISQPFSFEATPSSAGSSGLSSHPNRSRRRAISPPVQAAPPSHHVPPLGLGGAIISLNRARTDARSEQRRDRMRQQMQEFSQQQNGLLHRAGSIVRRVYTAVARNTPTFNHDTPNDNDLFNDGSDTDFTNDEEFPAMQMLLAHDLALDAMGGSGERFGHPARGFAFQEMLFRRAQARQRNQEVEYKPEYTHPGKPEPGFTFDFAPQTPLDDASAKGKEKAKAPIIIDLEAMDTDTDIAGPSSDATPSSSSGSLNVNTLLVCARCLDPLILGGALVGEEGRRRKIWALRCGHLIDGKCLDIVGVPDGELLEKEKEKARALDEVVDVKGKGKAKAVEIPTTQAPADNSIRARLRSRAQPHATHSPNASSPSSSSSSGVSTHPTVPQTNLGKRKRPSASTKQRIEASHDWTCPVPGCGRLHASAKIGGLWVPEPIPGTPGNTKGRRRVQWGQPEAEGSKQPSARGVVAVFV